MVPQGRGARGGLRLHASCPSPDATCASTRRRRRTPTPSTCTITTTTAPPTSRASWTPFFTCARYTQDEAGRPLARRLDPRLTITFDAKDYRRYCELYPECDIYLYVHWEQLAYRDVEIEPLEGVWVARFADMRAKIEERALVHHNYLRRKGDPRNANDCYLFDLRDPHLHQAPRVHAGCRGVEEGRRDGRRRRRGVRACRGAGTGRRSLSRA